MADDTPSGLIPELGGLLGTDTPVAADGVSSSGEEETRDGGFETRHEEMLERDENQRYESGSGATPDEVDPQKLFKTPSIDDIRWYYRHGSLAPTLVDKPVEDAFKYGFDIENNDVFQDILDEFTESIKRAYKKSRRDGMALLWFRLADGADGDHRPPTDVSDLAEIKVVTLDDLTDNKPPNFEEQLPEEYDDTVKDIDITDSGMVISKRVDDIERFEKPIGYLYDPGEAYQEKFIHHERVMQVSWRRSVDGDLDEFTYGEFEGDSILQPVVNLLRALEKGNWAVMQRLWRHSTPLHTMDMPEGADNEDYDKAERVMDGINAKSSLTVPPNFEMEVIEQSNSINVEEPYDVIFKQICAATEFTQSVLFGTQAGTVSGSEVDIKNYYNKVQKLRDNRFHDDFTIMAMMLEEWGLLDDNGFEVEWGPMFKIDRLDRAEAMSRHVQIVSQGIDRYVLSHEEARNLLDNWWVEWTDLGFSDMDEEDFDLLDRINVARNEMTKGSEETEVEGGTPRQGQNGGGREEGTTNQSTDPSQ